MFIFITMLKTILHSTLYKLNLFQYSYFLFHGGLGILNNYSNIFNIAYHKNKVRYNTNVECHQGRR